LPWKIRIRAGGVDQASFCLPVQELDAIDAAADRMKISRSHLIREALRRFLSTLPRTD